MTRQPTPFWLAAFALGAGLPALSLISACGVPPASPNAPNAPSAQDAETPVSLRGRFEKPSSKNVVEASEPLSLKTLGDSGFEALGAATLENLRGKGKVADLAAADLASFPARLKYARPRGAALLAGTPTTGTTGRGVIVGLPIDALARGYVFGGVVTGVSEKTLESLGNLKLSGVPSTSVRPLLSEFEGKVYLSLVGCSESCAEGSQRRPIVDIPVLGSNAAKNVVYIDLAPLALNLRIDGVFPDFFKSEVPGVVTTKSTKTTLVDFANDTLVFDIVNAAELQEKKDDGTDGEVKPFDLTTRYFLRAENTLEASFERRPSAPGVGFFTTLQPKKEAITRFSLAEYGNGAPIHYFIKNVPKQWQPSFEAGFAQWKSTFRLITGRDVLTWEFVDPASDLHSLLVTGDARYNVLEWDLDNQASYGGLGPSISDENSGQLLSAQTLIQGPAIIELYTAWYETWTKARALAKAGDTEGAERLAKEFDAKLMRRTGPPAEKTKVRARLNAALTLRVPSAQETLRDPIVKGEFFSFPESESFESYMDGYFQDIVAHELGHNLGLRHNFRGSMGRAGEIPDGRVSVSAMEYLDRNFRYRSRVGEYDAMAIAYGYTGQVPARTDMFCTDEEAASLTPDADTLRYRSPECNSSDGGVDGYGYLRDSLVKGVDLLLAKSLAVESPWVPEELFGRFSTYSTGMLSYARAASDTFKVWTNWTGSPTLPVRPQGHKRVRAWVIGDFQKAACSAERIEAALEAKSSPEAKKATLEKMKAQLAFVIDLATTKAELSKEEVSGCAATLASVETSLAAIASPAP